ncbi:MAG TPA: WxL domain-containing protein [Capillimicrobium sp.]|nr:WxL domain-containing protein [Capillimicrobium sp.]
MSTRRVAAIAAVIASLVAAASASAESDTTSVTITGGSLSYTVPLQADDFPNVQLNGLTQVVKANVDPYSITDARGSGAGWNLTISASQFSDGSGHTLPTGSLTLVNLGVPVPEVNLGGLVPPVPTLPASPIDGGTTQKIISAAALPLSGTGQWNFVPLANALVLSVPPTATPGTYTSTITTTLSTGP